MKRFLSAMVLLSMPLASAAADSANAANARVSLVYEHELPNVPGKSDQDGSRLLVQFANMTDAENRYRSSDYVYISQTHVANSIDLALVDGISPDFTTAGFAHTNPSSPLFVKCNAARR